MRKHKALTLKEYDRKIAREAAQKKTTDGIAATTAQQSASHAWDDPRTWR